MQSPHSLTQFSSVESNNGNAALPGKMTFWLRGRIRMCSDCIWLNISVLPSLMLLYDGPSACDCECDGNLILHGVAHSAA